MDETPLYKVMREKQIGQSELADRIGVRPLTVHLLVHGKARPRLETALSIARALETPVEQLFGEVK
jgi:DNA-binding XRE family transcriptional regulator